MNGQASKQASRSERDRVKNEKNYDLFVVDGGDADVL